MTILRDTNSGSLMFAEIMWVTHKHSRSVRALVIVLYIVILNHSLASISKSFFGLKTSHKRIYTATYLE